jgi:hypothetical protein
MTYKYNELQSQLQKTIFFIVNWKGNQIVWDKKFSHNLVVNYLQLSCN